MMVDLDKFLAAIRDIRALSPTYRLGGSGVDGTCDCIGLIIGAVRRAGGTWAGTHGSNYAARSEMAGALRRVAFPGDLEAGEAIYKARAPGDAGYALPPKYQTGGDMLDCYHVGVVMSVSPLEIWHCTSVGGNGGIRVDTKLGDPNKGGAWEWAGPLKKINYGEGLVMQEGEAQQALVVAASGSTVYLRKLPDKSSPYLAKVPVGIMVEVLEVGGEWCTVMALGKRGYMMRQFLELEDAEEGPVTEDGGQALEALVAALWPVWSPWRPVWRRWKRVRPGE